MAALCSVLGHHSERDGGELDLTICGLVTVDHTPSSFNFIITAHLQVGMVILLSPSTSGFFQDKNRCF